MEHTKLSRIWRKVDIDKTRRNRRVSKAISVLKRIKYGRVGMIVAVVALIGIVTYKIGDEVGSAATNTVGAFAVEPVETEPEPVYIYTEPEEPDIIQSGKIRCMIYTGGYVTCTGVEPYIEVIAD